MAKRRKNPSKNTQGPESEVLKIDGDWTQAVSKALRKPRPPGGWPDDVKPKKRTKKKS